MKSLSETLVYEIEIEVRKDGKLIEKRRLKGNSWTQNLYNHIKALIYGWSVSNVHTTPDGYTQQVYVDTAGNTHKLHATCCQNSYCGCNAGQGATFGLVIGSGTKPFSKDDVDLEAQYGTDVFDYGSHSISEPEAFKLVISRTFTNISDEEKTINEIGLKARLCAYYNTMITLLLARDVLDTPVSVPPGATATIRYIMTL